jgi:hypothetical protein
VGSKIKELIWLNCKETENTRQFIALCRGIPMIRVSSTLDEDSGGCWVDDPKAIIETIIHIMGKNCSHGSSVVPPLGESLGQLMKDLGNVACIVKNQP